MESISQIKIDEGVELRRAARFHRPAILALALTLLLGVVSPSLAQYTPPSGPVIWLAADSGISLTGSNVTGWSDQSGSGNNAAQTTGSNAPTLLASALNGKPAVHFNGTSSYLSIASIANDFSPGCTAFVVARPTNVASYQRFFDFGNGANANNFMFYRTGTTATLEYASLTGSTVGADLMAANAIVQNQFTIYEATQDTTSGALYANGHQISNGGAAAMPTVTRTSNFIGKSNWSADALFQGDIAEILIYNRRLTDAERQTGVTDK